MISFPRRRSRQTHGKQSSPVISNVPVEENLSATSGSYESQLLAWVSPVPAVHTPQPETLRAGSSQESCEFCHQTGHNLTTCPDLTPAAESQVPQISNAPKKSSRPRVRRTSHSPPGSAKSVSSVKTDTHRRKPHGHPAEVPVSSRDVSSRGRSDTYEQYDDLGCSASSVGQEQAPTQPRLKTSHSPHTSGILTRQRLDSTPSPARTSQRSPSTRPPRSRNTRDTISQQPRSRRTRSGSLTENSRTILSTSRASSLAPEGSIVSKKSVWSDRHSRHTTQQPGSLHTRLTGPPSSIPPKPPVVIDRPSTELSAHHDSYKKSIRQRKTISEYLCTRSLSLGPVSINALSHDPTSDPSMGNTSHNRYISASKPDQMRAPSTSSHGKIALLQPSSHVSEFARSQKIPHFLRVNTSTVECTVCHLDWQAQRLPDYGYTCTKCPPPHGPLHFRRISQTHVSCTLCGYEISDEALPSFQYTCPCPNIAEQHPSLQASHERDDPPPGTDHTLTPPTQVPTVGAQRTPAPPGPEKESDDGGDPLSSPSSIEHDTPITKTLPP